MIRHAQLSDIPQISELHLRVWRDKTWQGSAEGDAGLNHRIVENLRQIYFGHPWRDGPSRPLVHVDSNDRLTGALCSLSRPFTFRGKTRWGTISSEFVVDPDQRGSMVAISLMRKLLQGSQDFTIADRANDRSLRLWRTTGGTTAPLYGYHWVRPLRPVKFSLWWAGQLRKLAPLAHAARPLSGIVDRIVLRQKGNPFPPVTSSLTSCTLTPDNFVELYDELVVDELRPEYNQASIDWIWGRLGATWQEECQCEKHFVNDKQGRPVGWYIGQFIPGDVAYITQMVARQQFRQDVLNHVLSHAFDAGCVGTIGRGDGQFFEAVLTSHCQIVQGKHVLLHSNDAEITNAFRSGNAFFTLPEGEGCLHLTAAVERLPTITTPDLKSNLSSHSELPSHDTLHNTVID